MSAALEAFHFLRPAWLLALPLAWAWLIWRRRRPEAHNPWARVCDPELLPHLVQRAGPPSRWLLPAQLTGATLLFLALAGPTWERLPQPVFEAPRHRVLVMDLSRSMDAADLKPSRLRRAKIAANELLKAQQEGDTGLVAFAGDAFPVVPLTTDLGTVRHLLDSLATDLMPTQGSRVDRGIAEARALLEQAGATRGDILLFTDSTPDAEAGAAAAAALAAGLRVHVLAAGSRDGAPIPEPEGGWLTDASGNIVMARVDHAALRALAGRGGGRYAEVGRDAMDWARDGLNPLQAAERADDEFTADVWKDQGPWLLLPLLLLAATAFRRGWLMLLPLLLLPCYPLAPAQAQASAPESTPRQTPGWGERWAGLWQTDDQRAHELLERGEAEAAAKTFRREDWRAAAAYRAGDHARAAELWADQSGATAHYNRGNALARAGELEAAIEAYDQALAEDPALADAEHNREWVRELLKQQQQENESESGDSEQPPEGEDSDEDPAESPQDGGESGESGESGEQDSDNPDEQMGDREEAGEQETAPEAGEDGDAGEGEEPQPVASEFSPADEEQREAVRQWLNRLPDDPGRLLRNKFRRLQQRRGDEQEDDEQW